MAEERLSDQERELRRYDHQHDPARLLALTDGVFTIVITLLVWESTYRNSREVRASVRRCARFDLRSRRS